MALAAALVSRLSSLSPPQHAPQHDAVDTHVESVSSSISSPGEWHATTVGIAMHIDARVPPATSPSSGSPLRSALKKTLDTRPCATQPPAPSPIATEPDVLRPNEHLAVLLPKSLWKASVIDTSAPAHVAHLRRDAQPDSQASRCDIFLCSKSFSIFERRHVRCHNLVSSAPS